MSNITKQILLSCLTALLLAIGINHLLLNNSTESTGFVQLEQLFEEFKMKAEVQAKYDNIENSRNLLLDSLKLKVESYSSNYKISKSSQDKQRFEYYASELYRKQQEFNEKNAVLSEEFNKQVWSRLNQYIEQYGEDYDLDYIHGVSGSGNLMYGNPDKDITDAVIQYCNKKYKGE